MLDLLIKNISILQDKDVVQKGCIGIKDGYISSILCDELFLPEAKETLDGNGMLATPGLINTHTHAAMGLFRNYADDLELMDWLQTAIWPAEAKLTKDHVKWGTQLTIAEMIRSGTTTFSDMYFFMDTTAYVVAQTGIRAVLSRGLAGVSPTAEDALQENKNLFKQWHGFDNHRIKVMLGPHAPYTCPDAFLEKVVALSAELGAEIHMHLSETKTEVQEVTERTGKTPIAHMNTLGVFDQGCLAAHCVHVTPDDMDIMALKKVRVAHNPQSNLKLASGIAPLPEMIAKGITVGLGTDGSASNNNADMLEEVRLAALLHKGNTFDPKVVPAETAWKLGTVEGGKALGYSDLGLLAPGYRADIVLYDVSGLHWAPRYNDVASLVYAALSADCHTVVINGQIVMKNKELLTIDEEKLRDEINALSKDFI